MALSPATIYPGQVAIGDPNYPFGKAQNEIVDGDGSGTPLEQGLVNEIFGFQQSLLAEAGDTPNGTPEQVGASQYLDAVKTVAQNATAPRFAALETRADNLEFTLYYAAAFTVVDAQKDNGATFALATVWDSVGNFALSGGNSLKLPSNGWYEITISGSVTFTGSDDTPILDVWVSVAGAHASPAFVVKAVRAGTTINQLCSFSRTCVCHFTDRANQQISVQSGANGLSLKDTQLIIKRVG